MSDIQNTAQTTLGLTAVDPDKAGWKDESTEGMVIKRNPVIGTLAYGLTPLGYDQPALQVASGSPVLGYCFDNGELHLLALMAGRWNLENGTIFPEVTGGFATIDPETGVKHLPKKGALRELAEETDLDLDNVVFTCGIPFVGDRAFFVKDTSGDGNNVYMFELSTPHLARIRMSPNLELLHWTEFVKRTVDAITLGAIMRVVAALAENGKLTVAQA
jgi:hypothetical protein